MTINKKDQERLRRLSEAAESPGALPPGTTLRSAEATAEGRRLVADALGGVDEMEKVIRRGRKNLDPAQGRGDSPMVRVRIPEDRDTALARLEERLERNRSELVREAIDLLLDRYDAPEASAARARDANLQEAREHLTAAVASLDALGPTVAR